MSTVGAVVRFLARRVCDHDRAASEDPPGGQTTVLGSAAATPADEMTDEVDQSPRWALLLPLALAAGVGVVLAVIPPLLHDPVLRWPPASMTASVSLSALGALAAIVLGVVLDGRGAEEGIASLKQSSETSSRRDVRALARRLDRDTALAGAAQPVAAVIGTGGGLMLLLTDPLTATVVTMVSVLVVALTFFSSATTTDAREALQQRASERRRDQVAALRAAEDYWSSSRRSGLRHGLQQLVGVLLLAAAALAGAGAIAWQQTAPGPAVAVLLFASSSAPLLVTLATFRVLRAGAAREVAISVGLWVAVALLWTLGLALVVLVSGGPDAPAWWLATASGAVLLVHGATATWTAWGIATDRGPARYLRPRVLSYVRHRADQLERSDVGRPHRPRPPATRIGRFWWSMSGRDAS